MCVFACCVLLTTTICTSCSDPEPCKLDMWCLYFCQRPEHKCIHSAQHSLSRRGSQAQWQNKTIRLPFKIIKIKILKVITISCFSQVNIIMRGATPEVKSWNEMKVIDEIIEAPFTSFFFCILTYPWLKQKSQKVGHSFNSSSWQHCTFGVYVLYGPCGVSSSN